MLYDIYKIGKMDKETVKDIRKRIDKRLESFDPSKRIMPADHKGPWYFVVREILTIPHKPIKLEMFSRRFVYEWEAEEWMIFCISQNEEKRKNRRSRFRVISVATSQGDIFTP